MSVTPTVIRVTDDDDRVSIGEAIGYMCDDAKKLSRRGKVGTLSAEYTRIHGLIDAMLDDWEAAQ